MASAKIIFQQQSDNNSTPGSRDDLVLNSPVTVLNQDNTSVVSWQWTIVDKPANSTSSLVNSTASTTTFTPDVAGTYLIKLVINGTTSDQKGAAVKTANLSYRIPAASETTEFDTTRGWAAAANNALQLLDDGYTPATIPTFQSIYNESNPPSLTLNSTNNGIQIHDSSGGIGANLFEVDAYGNGTKYFTVSAAQTSVVGIFSSTGGKTGLGTSTPTTGYSIANDVQTHILNSGNNLLLIDTTTNASDSGLALYQSAAGKNASIFIDGADSQKLKIAFGTVDTHANRQTNTKITFQQDGSVGLGTTSPGYLLDVRGTGHFSGALTLDTGFVSGANSSMGGFKIASLGTPTASTDAVNKSYVDGLLATTDFQAIYNVSNPASFYLNSTNGALIIEDAQNHLGGATTPIFNIDSYGGTSTYFKVYRDGASLTAETGSNVINTTGAATGVNYVSLWASSASDIYAAGFDSSTNKQQLAHYNGSTWSVLTTYPGAQNDTANTVFGFASNNVYIGSSTNLAGPGGIWHTTDSGATWTQQYSVKGINVVWGSDSANIYAGVNDNSGVVLYSTGNGTWNATSGNVGTRYIYDIWGVSATEFWVATSDSIYYTANGGTSFTQQFNTNVNSTNFQSLGYSVNWKGIWGTNSSNVYAVGEYSGKGYIAYFNGTNWILQIANYDDIFNSIYGSSLNNIYAVASTAILYNNGNGAWVPLASLNLGAGTTYSGIFSLQYNNTYIGTSGANSPSVIQLAPAGGNAVVQNILTTGSVITSRITAPFVSGNESTGINFTAFNNSDLVTDEVAFNFDVSGVMNSSSSNARLFKFNNNGTEVFSVSGNSISPIFRVPTTGEFDSTSGTVLWSWNNGNLTAPTLTVSDNAFIDGYTQFGTSDGYGGDMYSPGGKPFTMRSDDDPYVAAAVVPSSTDNTNLTVWNTATQTTSAGPTQGFNSQRWVYSDGNGDQKTVSYIDGHGSYWIVGDTTGFTSYPATTRQIVAYRKDTGSAVEGLRLASFFDTASPTSASKVLTVGWYDTSISGYTEIFNATADGYTNFNNPITVDGYKIDISGGATSGQSLVYNGTSFVPNRIETPAISDNSNLLLTTTSLTNIVSYTPLINGDFSVFIYYRVVNAPTNLSITISWTDSSGAQTFTALASSSQSVNSYSLAPLYITANTTAPIVVSATAGTANNVYVSASIMSLASTLNADDNVPAVAEKADVFNYLVATTGATNIVSYTPPSNENYFVYIYYIVSNATTNVTIELTFDDSAGAQTLTILPTTSKAVGSYTVSPVYIQATTSAPITVTATAGTANNVSISATIMMV